MLEISGSATWALVRALAKVPLNIALTIFYLITEPTKFGQSRIDTGPRDLYRASSFYLQLFTVAFVIGSYLTYLDFYSGASEPRELVTLALQIALAVPIIYLLNVCFRQKVAFSGLLEAVLYVDAVYLVLLVSVGGLISYLSFGYAIRQGEN